MNTLKLSFKIILLTAITLFSQSILTINGKVYQKQNHDQDIVAWNENDNGNIQFLHSTPQDSIITAIFRFTKQPHSLSASASSNAESIEHEHFRQAVHSNTWRISSPHIAVIEHEYYTAINGAAVTGRLDFIRQLAALPMVAGYSLERTFEMNLSQSVKQIQADRVVKELGYDGFGVLVGVLDTGIDYNHYAFGGIGPGHRIIGGYDFVNDDADPMDDQGHGTHVAGIVGANSAHITGVAPGVGILAVKVLSENGTGLESDVLAAIEYCLDPDGNPATDDGVDIITMSFGAPPIPDDPLIQAVENATQAGVLCVASAGNSGLQNSGFETIGSPAAAASAIAVGSCNANFELSSFSSKGPTALTNLIKPEILAPGENITSTWLNNSERMAGGTSMAAPHVAGVAALLKQQYSNWPPAQLKSALVNSGDHVNANDTPYAVGNGCINAWTASTRPFSVQPGVLSFTPVDLTNTTWRDTLTMTVNNYDDHERYFQFNSQSPHNGIFIETSQPYLYLAPGADKQISVFLAVSPEVPIVKKYPFAYSGDILCLSEQDTLRTPFGVIKSNLLAIDFDVEPFFYVIYSPENNYYKLHQPDPGTKSYTHRLSEGHYNIISLFKEKSVESDTTLIVHLVEKQVETGDFQKILVSRVDAVWPAYALQNSNSSISYNDSLIYQEFWISLTCPSSSDFLHTWIDHVSQPPLLFVSQLGNQVRLETSIILAPECDPLLLNPYTVGVETETDVKLEVPADDYERFYVHTDPNNPDAFYQGFLAGFASCFYKQVEYPVSGRVINIYSTGRFLKNSPESIRLQKSAAEMDSTFFRYFEFGRFDADEEWHTYYDWIGKFRPQPDGRMLCFEHPHSRPFASHLIKNFSADPGDTLVFSRQKSALVPVFFVNGAFTEHGSAIYIDNKWNRGILDFPGVVDKYGYFSSYVPGDMYKSSFIRAGEKQYALQSDMDDTYYPADENARHRLLGSTVPVALSEQQGMTTFDFNFDFTAGIPCVDLFHVQSNGKPTDFVQKSKNNILRFTPWDWDDDITHVSLSLMASNGERIELPHQKIDREYQAVIPDTLPHEYIDVLASVTDAKGSRMEVILQPGFYFGEKKDKRTFHGRLYVSSYNLLNPKERTYAVGDTLNFDIDLKTFGNENLENIQVNFPTHPYVVTLSDSIRHLKEMSPGDSTTLNASFLITSIPKEEPHISFSIPLQWTSNGLNFERTFDLHLPTDVPTSIKDQDAAEDLKFQLCGNYPNPFNSETVIEFTIPQTGQVKLDIFNISGQRVRTLVDKTLRPGSHVVKWDGCDDVGTSVSSGLYFYRIGFTDKKIVGKMLLQR